MSLHGQIMSLPCPPMPAGLNPEVATAFKSGHRDARHAAAELAIAVERQCAELLAALKAVMHSKDARALAMANAAIANAEAKQ